ncbi:MAG TPA: class I SAM-dependent methyltransferase [Gaiellaceae bacterium]|nr:class I SAM-dependent methyltransferase [Gaiellaceae bacterium]
MPGAAELTGELWGARAEAWAEHEPQGTPIFETVLARAGVTRGTRLLDLGCATGTLCALAAARGARVTGLDAAAALLALARARVPAGDFLLGDLQVLPFADGSFDLVVGVNSFQFAADPVAALREAARVARGGSVAAAVWGPPEEVELFVPVRALARLLGTQQAAGRSLFDPGALEEAFAEAGLSVRESGQERMAFAWPDEARMLRELTSAGGVVRVARAVGDERVQEVLLEAMQPFRAAGGGYRLENAWRYVVASAS